MRLSRALGLLPLLLLPAGYAVAQVGAAPAAEPGVPAEAPLSPQEQLQTAQQYLTTMGEALANVRQGAGRGGRSLDGFEVTALINPLILEPGQTLRSPEVVARIGSAIMANVHFLVDLAKETGAEPPDYVKPIWNDYLAFNEARDARTRHQALHQSHYTYLEPEEARFITPEMIRNFCIAGQPEEIVEQLQELERQGLGGISFIAPLKRQYRMVEDFAERTFASASRFNAKRLSIGSSFARVDGSTRRTKCSRRRRRTSSERCDSAIWRASSMGFGRARFVPAMPYLLAR